MYFNPIDFLKIAEDLSKGNTEAHYRTSISRSYYAIFGMIRTRYNFFVPKGLSVHQKLIDHLKSSPVPEERTLGSRLETLFTHRKNADYEYERKSLESFPVNSITLAKSIIELFKKI